MDKVTQPFGEKLYAPFSRAQIEAIKKFQASNFHGFTCCGFMGCSRPAELNYGELTPTQDGMECPCGAYLQNWVYKQMVEL